MLGSQGAGRQGTARPHRRQMRLFTVGEVPPRPCTVSVPGEPRALGTPGWESADGFLRGQIVNISGFCSLWLSKITPC